MGFFSNRFKPKQPSAIKLMYNNTSIIGEERHKNNWYIINNFYTSVKPLDILAVAVSYEREGAKYRNKAIEYFEAFLSNPEEIPIIQNRYSYDRKPVRYISYWEIYSSLAILYEKEYQFDNAIKYLKKLPQESNFKNSADYTRVGDVLAKIDINKCVNYYKELMRTDIYNEFKYTIDIHYKEALEKQAKGYVFRPRKRKT